MEMGAKVVLSSVDVCGVYSEWNQRSVGLVQTHGDLGLLSAAEDDINAIEFTRHGIEFV